MKNFDWKFWIGTIAVPIALAWWQQTSQVRQPIVAAPTQIAASNNSPSTTTGSWSDVSPYVAQYWPLGVMSLLIAINTTIAVRHKRGLSVTSEALSLAAAKIRESNEAAAAKKPYPKVEIWRHVSGNADLTEKVRGLFEKAGWEVSYGHETNLPQHAKGVTICGGKNVERNSAIWGLGTLHVKPGVEQRNANPPDLQVIIGTVSPDELQSVGEWAVKQIASEREAAVNALGSCRREFALARMKWVGERAKSTNSKLPVRIRFADYADYTLVQRIEAVFKEQAEYWEIEIDGTNKPVIKPSPDHENPKERFKVIFDTGFMMAYNEIGGAFKDGGFVEEVIGFRTTDRFDGPLIIEVLPTIKRSESNG